MTEKETTISNISESFTRMTNSFTENKNTPQFIGIFALGILIVLIVFICIYVAKGSTVSYMNSVKANDSIISLYYPPIQYDSCGNIIVIDSSGNITGNDGTYYINDYYIYGSYNSCNMSGRNKNNVVGIYGLTYVISQGTRFIDFEIYNKNNEPIIATSSNPSNYYIKESDNYVLFKDAIDTIIKNAFSIMYSPNPNDPIFLHLRIKSTNHNMMTRIIDILNPYRNQFLLGPKYNYEYQSCSVDNNNETVCKSKNLARVPLYFFQKKIILMLDRSNTAAFEYSDLMELVNITTDSMNCRLLTNHDMIYSPDQFELLEFNKLSMTIVTPDVGVKSENPSLQSSMKLGIQIDAIDFSNPDENMKKAQETFNIQGFAFILKPPELRFKPVIYNIPDDNPEGYSYAKRTLQGKGYSWNI
jgi:hypothetical protein